MSQIKMRGKLVGVEKLGRASKDDDSILFTPETTEATGVIKYLGEEAPKDLTIGTMVYYGDKRTQITVEGREIIVMDADNILAVVDESPAS